MPHHVKSFVLLLFMLVMATACVESDDAGYDGAELYALNCSNCHGVYGEGDGAVTPALSVVLMDLRRLSARNDGEFPTEFVTRIIDGREVRAAHGPEGMPTWGAEFSRGEGLGEDAQARVAAKIGAIADFLREIQIED